MKQMKKEIVNIFDISYEGSGVGKVQGKVCFVAKSLPEEVVEAEVLKETNSYCTAVAEKVLERNQHRVEPKCPYFQVCGGCDFQHCDEKYERELKIQILKNELKKVGENFEVEYVPCDKRFFYRNKIKFEVKGEEIGFFKAKSREFLPIQKCQIADEKINFAADLVRQFLKENRLQNLKNVYIKKVGENIGICFLFDKNAEKLRKNVKNLHIFGDFSVFFAFGDVLESDKTQVVCMYGDDVLRANFDGQVVEFDISAFNQVNDYVAEKLYAFLCEDSKDKVVVNAYSGQGILTYLLSKNAKMVYGIEYQKSAHMKAEKLLNNGKFENICGKVEEKLASVLKRDKVDMMVLDPAREGCAKSVLEAIGSSEIDKIYYVSCHFASLVRDLKTLLEKYAVEKVKIFDMFPCTANLETVVVLKRKGGF